MAVKSGFFNSVAGDRKYDADDVNNFFNGFLADGVLSMVGDVLVVSPSSGMTVSVGSGKAWFNNSWLVNTSDHFLLLPDAHISLDRIDIIAMDFDKTDLVRDNEIIIIEGTPGSTPLPPTLVDEEDHIQVPLAEIYVAQGVTDIDAGDITSFIGTIECPFATGLLQQLTIDELLTQWRTQFDEWMDEIEAVLASIESGDVFNYLDEIAERVTPGRNLIINGDMIVNQYSSESKVNYSSSASQGLYPRAVADRWKLPLVSAGTWTLSREDVGDGRKAFRMACTTARASLLSSSIFQFVQEIESSRLGSLLKGFGDAKDLMLRWQFRSNKTGTYIVQIEDVLNTWSISTSFSYSSSGTWVDYEWLIPAETQQSLALNNLGGLRVIFWLVAGSNFTGGGSLQTIWGTTTVNKQAFGQVNLAAAVSNYVDITDVQLEVGRIKTVYDRLSHDEVLLLCSRYKEVYDTFLLIGLSSNVNSVLGLDKYRTRKRTAPTYSFSSGSIYIPGSGSEALTAINADGIFGTDQADRPSYFLSTAETLTVGNIYWCALVDLVFDAELY
jgi:hypothetical protein